MTSEEARKKVSSCERDIKSAYRGLWGSAKEVGTTGYNAALRDKVRIEEDASHNTMTRVGLSVLVIVFGFILCVASHPGWGVLLIIVGGVLAYNMYQSASTEAKKRSDAANSTLSSVSSRQSQLNSVLESNKSI